MIERVAVRQVIRTVVPVPATVPVPVPVPVPAPAPVRVLVPFVLLLCRVLPAGSQPAVAMPMRVMPKPARSMMAFWRWSIEEASTRNEPVTPAAAPSMV